jgi:hypothetical protein
MVMPPGIDREGLKLLFPIPVGLIGILTPELIILGWPGIMLPTCCLIMFCMGPPGPTICPPTLLTMVLVMGPLGIWLDMMVC